LEVGAVGEVVHVAVGFFEEDGGAGEEFAVDDGEVGEAGGVAVIVVAETGGELGGGAGGGFAGDGVDGANLGGAAEGGGLRAFEDIDAFKVEEGDVGAVVVGEVDAVLENGDALGDARVVVVGGDAAEIVAGGGDGLFGDEETGDERGEFAVGGDAGVFEDDAGVAGDGGGAGETEILGQLGGDLDGLENDGFVGAGADTGKQEDGRGEKTAVGETHGDQRERDWRLAAKRMAAAIKSVPATARRSGRGRRTMQSTTVAAMSKATTATMRTGRLPEGANMGGA